MIVTGTASGKTLCYNLPVLDSLIKNQAARGLYLFPTRALTQDQVSSLRDIVNTNRQAAPGFGMSEILESLRPAVYDGDTLTSSRPTIRENARLILTNPDMLHTGILPHHTAWATFFRNLQFVVLDEIHTYRGVFGSHVTNVIRRLKRITRFYGAKPRFIMTSATIGNPEMLAQNLIEERVTIVAEDGSARGKKHFLLYNPPMINPDLGLRRSAYQEGVRIAEDLMTGDVQTIVFARTRRSVEILLTYLREKAVLPDSQSAADEIRGYRSGYLPRQRREIERGLRDGKVRVVVATNALELGIDIGGMGASVLVGYPGTIAGTWQQAGRAGRGEADSLTILIASPDPLDQFLMRHPEYFFERDPEQALINPDNLLILLGHLRCAAFELPFQAGDVFGKMDVDHLREFLDYLVSEGSLHRSGAKYFWTADQYPSQGISLRSASPETIVLQKMAEDSAPQVIGEVDYASASWMVHPGAVYLHEAQAYLVHDLDLERRIAHLEALEADYYTEPSHETSVSLIEEYRRSEVQGASKAFGEILVTSRVVGFRRVRWQTHENLGMESLDLPPFELTTTGYWLGFAEKTIDQLREQGLWLSDPNRYGPGWAALRDQVRARDGYRCQVCGAPETERAHDVHHRVPFRAFITPEAANQASNLVTLCAACHRRVEAAVRIRSGLAGLAYTLNHLASLFVMCDPGDLGVYYDPQSALMENRPVVVIYDHVPGGIGLSERLFEMHAELMIRARELVSTCACSDGCPSCVGPGGEAGSGGKRETLALLEELCGEEPRI